PVPDDHPYHGHGGVLGAEEDCAPQRGHIPCVRTNVRRLTPGDDSPRGRSELPALPDARSSCGALPPRPRQALPTGCSLTHDATRYTQYAIRLTFHVLRMTHKAPSLFDWSIVGPAIGDSFRKLDPRLMVKNPVMFVTMVGAVLTTAGIFTCAPAERNFITQL